MEKDEAVPRWLTIAGWFGTAAILGAYAANARGWLSASDPAYHGLNLAGAIGVGLVCLARRTWQAFVLEVLWAVIAAVALCGAS